MQWISKIKSLAVFGLFLFPIKLLAHGSEVEDIHHENKLESIVLSLPERLAEISPRVVLVAAIIIGLAIIISLLIKKKSDGLKKVLFWTITALTILATLFIAGSTVMLNLASVTKGPVHWHADYKIFYCGEEISLINSEGLLNRVGSSVLHEHGDNRLHVEGPVLELEDVSLGSYFGTVGGDLREGYMKIPTNQGEVVMKDGDKCDQDKYQNAIGGSAGGPNTYAQLLKPATLQVFLYKTSDDLVTQTKLEDYSDYVLSPATTVPPGDCVIFEFTSEQKFLTQNICDFYKIDIGKGKLKYLQ